MLHALPRPPANAALERVEPRADKVRGIERDRVRADAAARLFGGPSATVRVGRFELRRLLGRGANGVVYAAFDPRLEREVALKLLTSDGDEHRLLAEARALARLAHPNVLPVYDAGVERGLPFIVSELVEGGTLRTWAATPRSRDEKLRVLVETGRGLAVGHQRALVHRDVKPENILVGTDGRARVADFGLSSFIEAPRDVAAGAPLPGTIRYMAPEHISGDRADPLSDQFSFCVVAWELLTGAHPFAASSVPELQTAILAGRIEGAPSSDPVLQAVARGLSASAAARFTSMEALVGALERRPRSRAIAVGAVIGGVALLATTAAVAATSWPRAAKTPPTMRPTADATATATATTTSTAPAPSADLREREREVSIAASRMAQEGRYDECSKFLSTRADTDALLLLWLGCARVAPDPMELERACEAWNGATRTPSDSPMVLECSPVVIQANRQWRAGDVRGCAETLLAAPPTLIGNIALAKCVQKAAEDPAGGGPSSPASKALYERQCRYQHMLPGGDPRRVDECKSLR